MDRRKRLYAGALPSAGYGCAHRLFHPIEQLRAVAQEAHLDHEIVQVTKPYRRSYVAALKRLKDERGIDAVVTGDIDFVDGRPNWIRECAEGAKMEALMPLWQCDRLDILNEVVARGIRARISWINAPELPVAWLGRSIDEEFISDISALAGNYEIDICGENGEYHTMVDSI